MNSYRKTFVECGEKGCGKTTYVKNKWTKHIILQCDDPLNELKTTSVLENAMFLVYGKSYQSPYESISDLRKAVQDGYTIIIDNAELINVDILKSIINAVISISNAILVFTFDIDCKYIYQCKIYRKLIEWDVISNSVRQENFCAPLETFRMIITDRLPKISKVMIDELLEISNLNFNNLKNLIWLIINKCYSLDKVSDEIIAEYSSSLVEEKFSSLPGDLFDVLKKTSVIGEIFNKCILESPKGFHISGVKAYLEKLEAMNVFIRHYLDDDIYQYASNTIHIGVMKRIEPSEKIEWEKVLLNYYLEKIRLEKSDDIMLDHLRQIRRLSCSLNDNETAFFANKILFRLYLKIGDLHKAVNTLDELINLCKEYIQDESLCQFFYFYKTVINVKLGFSKEALDTVNIIRNEYPYISPLYTQYYYAKCLYNEGDVDQSYVEIINLSNKLKPTSKEAVENQPIYAMTYSLLATIQHHFGIADYGQRYYGLALNHSKNKIEDDEIYYDILKKCDMYYPFSYSKQIFPEIVSYFELKEKLYEASEVNLNWATEIMFNESESYNDAEKIMSKAIKVFENTPNQRLVYAYNNMAILTILYTGNFMESATLLEKCKLVGLSSFTYMTIYLNLSMCYLVLYGHNSTQFIAAYNDFLKYNSYIKSRKNATQYDNIYKDLMELAVLENKGEKTEVILMIEKVLSENVPLFFIPILNDMKGRNSEVFTKQSNYNDNVNYYRSLNKHKIFLAEFRFWE